MGANNFFDTLLPAPPHEAARPGTRQLDVTTISDQVWLRIGAVNDTSGSARYSVALDAAALSGLIDGLCRAAGYLQIPLQLNEARLIKDD